MDPTNSIQVLAAAIIAAVQATNAPVLPTRPPPVPPAALFAGASRAVGVAVPQLTTLKLDVPYPPEKLSSDIIIRIYSTTNIVTPDWQILTNLMNGRTSCLVQVYPAARYYSSTSYSVFWGQESGTSAFGSTPHGPANQRTCL